jgi:hypothetical protein
LERQGRLGVAAEAQKPGNPMRGLASGWRVRRGTDTGDGNAEEIAGPGGSSQIDLTAFTVASYHDKNSLMAFDNNAITKPGEITQRGNR